MLRPPNGAADLSVETVENPLFLSPLRYNVRMIIMLRISMPRFQHYDYRQHILLSINLEEQLQPGTFEHALHDLVDNNIEKLQRYGQIAA